MTTFFSILISCLVLLFGIVYITKETIQMFNNEDIWN